VEVAVVGEVAAAAEEELSSNTQRVQLLGVSHTRLWLGTAEMGGQEFLQAILEAMEAPAPLVRSSRSAVVVVAQIMTMTERLVAMEEEVGTATLAPTLCKLTKVATVESMGMASRADSGLRSPGMAEEVEVLEGWESMAPTRNVVMVAQDTFCSCRAPLLCATVGTMEVASAGEGAGGRTIHLVVRVLGDQVGVATARPLGPTTMETTALTDMVAVVAADQPFITMVETAAQAALAW
jgi:hypothetical protein